MKQVININFHGRVVPIEVSAFELLKEYTDSLNRYFEGEEGREEIINDIESRIGELFQEKLKAGATCITDEDVQAIIRNMGRPEDFETDSAAADAANNTRTNSNENFYQFNQAGKNKKLYRDENDKVLGGVCSGLAHYFGIDVAVVRIIFVILAISFGFGIIPYLVLWVAVPSSATMEIGGLRKKLYRDNDDKIIAGVCSGLGNYFGINAWIPRVLFVLPLLSFAANWHDFHFVRFAFSPGSVIIYIILWLVLPEALTTSEKLEMKGEKVDMNSIKNSIVGEMKDLQDRAQKFSKEAKNFAQEKGGTVGADITAAARRGSRSLGDIIALLFKIFLYFILGCIGFALVAALFTLAVFAIGIFPMKDFVLTGGWQNILAWGTLIFFIAVPIIGILTWIIRRITKMRKNSRMITGSFIALWTLGWICFFGLISFLGRDFRSSNHYQEQEVYLNNPTINRLEVTSLTPGTKLFNNRWLRFEPFDGISEDDTLFVKNIEVQLVKSNSDSFKVTMLKMARGSNKRYADTLAAKINVNIYQQDSLLILDRGIPINKTDKFRNQRVVLTIYVPVGKTVRVDHSIGWANNIRFSGPWRDDWDIDFEDVERGWDVDKEYIMKEDGLYDLNGKPAGRSDNWQSGSQPMNTEDQNGVQKDANGNIIIQDGDGYRYPGKNPARIDSPVKVPIPPSAPDLQKTKDSLKKEKEKIDKQLEIMGANKTESSAVVTYRIAGYDPLMMMR